VKFDMGTHHKPPCEFGMK